MPHSHKKKTRAVKCCLAVGLLAIAAAIGVLFGPSALVLAQGPTRIDPLADNDVGTLQGKYLEADLDTLVGCYAETAPRGYIMPINTPGATIYIGVELPKSKLADADAVVRTPSAGSMMRTGQLPLGRLPGDGARHAATHGRRNRSTVPRVSARGRFWRR